MKKILFLIIVVGVLTGIQAQAAGWLSGYNYRKQLTFNNSGQSENLANFPVLVKLTAANFDFSKAQSAGQDIRFTDSDGTTPLKYEIEKWTANTEAYIWVKVPQVDGSSAADLIYLYYGNGSASDGQDKVNVWDSNFKGVWHFNSASSSEPDATINNNVGTVNGAARGVTGKIGSAFRFDGTDDYVRAQVPSFNTNNVYTFELWFQTPSTVSNGMLANLGTNVAAWDELEWQTNTYINAANYAGPWLTGTTPLSTNTWYHVVFIHDSANNVIKTYINGVLDINGSYPTYDLSTAAQQLDIAGTRRYRNGLIDEVRISNSSRSANWVKAQYLSTNLAFITFGSQEQNLTAPTVTTQAATSILTTSVTGNGNITATGGANATERGFKYGLTQTDTWSASDSGSFGTGAYTKAITGLSSGTLYYIRAFAVNSAGTSYGSYVSFTTAVPPPPPCQSHNISGYAWSENIGWISFSCKNTGASGDFGVDINSPAGTFTGYAWSENIGWISFAPSGPYPASPNYPACIDFPGNGQACDGIGNYNIGGWARALNYGGGWDGWIKLRGSNYGVSVSSNGNFSGWAWSDSVVGWISLTSRNCDANNDGKSDGVPAGCPAAGTSMPGSGYGARTSLSFNSPPDKPTTFETNWNRCSFQGSAVPTLSWTYSDQDGDPQSAYEVEVDDNSSFNAPKFNHLVNLAATSYVLNLSEDDDPPDPGGDWIQQLAWNSTYFWRVRVKDSFGNWSDWSNSSQSKTDKHASPWVNFAWVPSEPTQKETVEFSDQTQTFEGTTIISRLWTIISGTGVYVDNTNNATSAPHIQFSTVNNTLRLEITDSDNYTCYSDKDIIVQLPLPEYKEIPPIIWIKKTFAALIDFFDGF